MQSKKKINTCRKLILKEEEGEIRASYNLQTGRFLLVFFLFFFVSELFTFLTSLSSSTRTPGLGLHEGLGNFGHGVSMGHTGGRTDRAQTKKVGGHWVPQLRSLPAILARGLRIRTAHSPFPPH